MTRPAFSLEILESRRMLSAAASGITKTGIEPAETTPSLTAAVQATKLPGTIVAGQAIHDATEVQIANQTASTLIKGAAIVSLYLSSGGLVDGSSVLLATEKHAVNLRPGASTSLQVQTKSVPSMAAGSYTLLAQVTDPAGLSESSVAGPAVQVQAPVVTLSIGAVSAVYPSIQTRRTSANFSAIVTNDGNISTSGKASIGVGVWFYEYGLPFNEYSRTLVIKPGHSLVLHVQFWPARANSLFSGDEYLPYVSVVQDGSYVQATGSTYFLNER